MINLNGKPFEFVHGQSLATLLLQLKLDPMRLAVEVNRDLVPRKEHASFIIKEGDSVEIVTLVGGG